MHRVIRLTEDEQVLPSDILALTFTRAAAQELRQRVAEAVGEGTVPPRVRTLHSFALSQLLTNGSKLESLPQPVRIADDWEESEVIIPDLQATLSLDRRDVRKLFGNLSADWETLRADQDDWEKLLPNPEFVGAWQRHRTLYGYTMRNELVYQLKRALDQVDDLQLDGAGQHLLIDAYQDLNPCDLAVVERLASPGVELYVAGDDD